MELLHESLVNFQVAVDITENNFELHYPSIVSTINSCDFIAFDLEFSGTDYKSYFRSVYVDTFETRYAKYRVDAENFYPIELGICCFTWDDASNCYRSRPFNFFISPYAHKLNNPNLAIRASTLGFLREHNFKFGRLFSEGIPTLRKSDEERILNCMRMSVDRYDYKNEYERIEIDKAIQQIDQWLSTVNAATVPSTEDNDESPVTYTLLLGPFDSHKRKLLYQLVGHMYPFISMKETDDDNATLGKSKSRYTRVFLTKKPSEVATRQIPDICQHAGVRRVVEAILQSQKPLIGFQAMGDLAFMIGGIYKELPKRLVDFLVMIEELKVLVDMKAIVELPFLVDEELDKCSLSKAFEKVHDVYYGEPDILSALIDDSNISAHDAAHDAYMTGVLFVKLLYRCGMKREHVLQFNDLLENPEKQKELPPMMKSFVEKLNHVNLYHMNHCMPLRLSLYNNLLNQYHEELCDREDVLVIEDIAPWLNTKHFSTFFKNRYAVSSGIYYNWLDDFTLLVKLPSKDIVSKVCEDWVTEVTSEESEGAKYKMPTDFMNRHVVMKDLRISRFSRYEEMCFVNKQYVRNCFYVCSPFMTLRTFFE